MTQCVGYKPAYVNVACLTCLLVYCYSVRYSVNAAGCFVVRGDDGVQNLYYFSLARSWKHGGLNGHYLCDEADAFE